MILSEVATLGKYVSKSVCIGEAFKVDILKMVMSVYVIVLLLQNLTVVITIH